jgi:hypothetical protein
MLLHSAFNASGAIFFPLFDGAHAEQQTMLLAIVIAVTGTAIAVITGPSLTRRRVAPAASVPAASPVAAK